MNKKRSTEIGLYFLFGGLAGACLVLLFTPQTGRETRELVSERMREGGKLAKRALSRAKNLMSETVEEGQEIVRRALAHGRLFVHEATRADEPLGS